MHVSPKKHSVTFQVSPLFGTIYNSLYLLAKSMHNTRRAGRWFSGTNLAYFTRNITFTGFNQDIQTDEQGNGQNNYVILDTEAWGTQLYRCFLVDMTSDLVLFAGRFIHFPGESPPPSDSSCWFEDNAICTGGTTKKIINHTSLCSVKTYHFKFLYMYIMVSVAAVHSFYI